MTFDRLGLNAPILRALEEQGYTEPSPIQESAIPPALAGRDVLGCAQTGTGKTCAFATPILQRLAAGKGPRTPRALILTPTRELAIQIGQSFADYGKYLPLRCAVIFGGVSQVPQTTALERGVDILVATPGRLGDLYQQKRMDLSKIEIFVLDEADRMLDMGFIHDVKKILRWLPDKKQTMLFSATMPEEVAELVSSLLHNPVRVAVTPVSSPVDAIGQTAYFVDRDNKTALLASLLSQSQVKNALIFTRTKHGANKVARDLARHGISAAAIHGNKSQSARQQALGDFKEGRVRCLVATDIAARGLDIEELSHVVNYNLPEVPETYIHRIGRTGRAGRGGQAVALVEYGETPLLRDIEKLMGRAVPVTEGHPFPMRSFEPLQRDKTGRILHPGDVEARQAAKARKGEHGSPAGKAAPREKASRPAREVSARPAAERPARPAAVRPARPAAEKSAGTGAQQPARPAAERRRGIRPGVLMDTGAAMPDANVRRPDPLAGDRIMDATARLLAPRKAASPGRTPQDSGAGRRSRETSEPSPKKQADSRQAAPQKQADGRQAAPQKQVDGRRNSHSSDGRSGRGGGRRDGRTGRPQPPEDKVKDSTQQKTLIKPYYLEIK